MLEILSSIIIPLILICVEVTGWEIPALCLYYPSFLLEGLERTENLSQDIRSPGRGLNPVSPEYKWSVNHSSTTFGSFLLAKTLIYEFS
jgi:hypothetical protein